MTYNTIMKIYVVALLLSISDAAADNPKKPPFAFYKLHNKISKGHIFEALKEMEDNIPDDKSYGRKESYYTFFSIYDNGYIFKEPRPIKEDKKLKKKVEKYQPYDAVEEIIKLAKNRQIVILNEAHHLSFHRAFGQKLAIALKKIGFEFLAVETLTTNLTLGPINIKYPHRSTGAYSMAPVFGDFLRQSINIGYTLASYDQTFEQGTKRAILKGWDKIQERELFQAKNIVDTILKKNPSAKIFIYVGYSHADESWVTLKNGKKVGWMAAHLKKMTGTDPLTIDQAFGSDAIRFNNRANDPVFDYVMQQNKIHQTTVMKDKQGKFLTSKIFDNKIDLTVFHPKQKMIEGRPDWLRMEGYRKPLILKNSDYFTKGSVMLQAFVENETKSPIAMDQIIIKDAKGTSTFLLPLGNYKLISLDETGKKTFLGNIKVKENKLHFVVN